MNKNLLKSIIATAGLIGTISAHAVPITFTGSSGSLAASVSFDMSGDDLLVRLINTSLGDPHAPGDILTGVIFSLPGNPLLAKISAILSPGSTVIHGAGTDPGNVVGGEWAYTNLLSGAYVGQQAIYASGFFDGNARFPGNNLQGPGSVAGIEYGLTTVNDAPGNDNGGIKNEGLIKNSVDFVLSGLSPTFSLSMLSNVSFQYGSSLTETNIPGSCSGLCSPPPRITELPEPSSMLLSALGLLAAAGWSVRRTKKN